VTYLLSASGVSLVAASLQTVLFLGVLLLGLHEAAPSGRSSAVVTVVALVGSAVALAGALSHTTAGEAGADLWKTVLLLTSAVLVVRRVLARPTVTVQSIYGALSAYLIVGLMFAAFYAALQRLDPPFFAHHQPASTQTFQYFSFTTLTTLGYGDFTAAGNDGRAVAVIEALTGQVFLATLVARLVAAFRPLAREPDPTPEPRPSRARARPGSPISYRRRTRNRSP
jgi:Ion channel